VVQIPGRIVKLILANEAGDVLGELASFEVKTPWLQEVAEIVEGAKEKFNLNVTIIRLIGVVEQSSGNLVTYLAEVAESANLGDLKLEVCEREFSDAGKRLAYATVGGPAADLVWVTGLLACRDEEICGASQIRTWNLSSIWRIDTKSTSYWLKSVPPFFAHEPQVIELLNDECVPKLVGYEGTRLLMEHIPGNDLYDANFEQMKLMIGRLVKLQCQQIGNADQLVSLGLQDWRVASMATKLKSVIGRHLDAFDSNHRLALARLIKSMPARLEVLANSGLPDTFVHGDFHPGNWRGEADEIIILDWGDCIVGHPMLDFPGLLDRVDASLRPSLKIYWCEQWQLRFPDAELETVSRVIEPLAALRMAWVYQMFLDNIEPSEHVYHQDDPVECISRALALAEDEAEYEGES
jgi:hypothetical protein